MVVTLKNTGLKVAVSKDAYNVFPEQRGERKVLEPDYRLTYEKLREYGFDPNAEVLYAIEILQTLRK